MKQNFSILWDIVKVFPNSLEELNDQAGRFYSAWWKIVVKQFR